MRPRGRTLPATVRLPATGRRPDPTLALGSQQVPNDEDPRAVEARGQVAGSRVFVSPAYDGHPDDSEEAGVSFAPGV